jgi:hypothetical protein
MDVVAVIPYVQQFSVVMYSSEECTDRIVFTDTTYRVGRSIVD